MCRDGRKRCLEIGGEALGPRRCEFLTRPSAGALGSPARGGGRVRCDATQLCRKCSGMLAFRGFGLSRFHSRRGRVCVWCGLVNMLGMWQHWQHFVVSCWW